MTHRMDVNDLCDRLMNERSAPRVLDDSDRNILASLAHEACETHCVDCGTCLGEDAETVAIGPGGVKYADVPYITINNEDYCQECAS